ARRPDFTHLVVVGGFHRRPDPDQLGALVVHAHGDLEIAVVVDREGCALGFELGLHDGVMVRGQHGGGQQGQGDQGGAKRHGRAPGAVAGGIRPVHLILAPCPRIAHPNANTTMAWRSRPPSPRSSGRPCTRWSCSTMTSRPWTSWSRSCRFSLPST